MEIDSWKVERDLWILYRKVGGGDGSTTTMSSSCCFFLSLSLSSLLFSSRCFSENGGVKGARDSFRYEANANIYLR